MDQNAPYFVDVEVPEAVLLSSGPKAIKTVHPNTCGAVWYKADQASVTSDAEGAVKIWHAKEGLGTDAIQAKPNTGNLRLADAGGLELHAGVNAGMVIQDGLIEPASFTLAVRYASDHGEARSLLTINPNDYDNYLFLAEKDGNISWQDQQDTATLTMHAPKGGGWIVAGYDKGHLSLATASGGGALSAPLRSRAKADDVHAAFNGACDVFIGCRSHRKGIVKTLGSARIFDVLLWVDQDYSAQDQTTLASVLRHCESKGTTT
jgi:hypothetical protein